MKGGVWVRWWHTAVRWRWTSYQVQVVRKPVTTSLMLLPCSYIAWPTHRLQSEVRGAVIPIFMSNLKVTLCWCYGAAASWNCPSFPPVASFLLHCVCSTPCPTGFETWLGWKWSFGFTPGYFSARSVPSSDYQYSLRLGSSGTRRRWEHWVSHPFLQEPDGVSAVSSSSAEALGWAGRAGAMLHFFHQPHCSPLTHTALGVHPYEGTPAPVLAQAKEADPSPITASVPMGGSRRRQRGAAGQCNRPPGDKSWLRGGAELRHTGRWVRVPQVFCRIIFSLCVLQPWVGLMQDKALQRHFFSSQ